MGWPGRGLLAKKAKNHPGRNGTPPCPGGSSLPGPEPLKGPKGGVGVTARGFKGYP